MSFIAPAGTPLSAATYALGLWDGLSGTSALDRLQSSLARHSGHRDCWTFSTGRAAMVAALTAMRTLTRDASRNEVIVPAYTCYSVPASIVKAGLRPRLCDVDPLTLSMDLRQLARFDFSRVLAIVTANLYGFPNELAAIERIAQTENVRLLDDAAQALGARHSGRAVGGFGDVGLYSFDKGKNITSLDGGALVASRPDLSQALCGIHDSLPVMSAAGAASRAAKLAAYSILLRPQLYGLVRKLPFLGKTVYDESYPVEAYSRLLAGFANRLLEQLPRLTAGRTTNARKMTDALASVPGIAAIRPTETAEPACTRLPLFVADAAKRAAVVNALVDAGIGATCSYPNALCDVPEVARYLPPQDLDMPVARSVATRIVTLPTHAYCPEDLADRVRSTLLALKL